MRTIRKAGSESCKTPDGRQSATVYDPAGQVMAKWRGGSGWINTSTSTPSPSAPIAASAWNPAVYAGTGPIEYESYCNGLPQTGSANCYTPNGKPIYAIDADNHVTQYQYDGQDRLRITYFPDPTSGALCTAASSDGALPTCSGLATYELSTYDPVGNLLSLQTRRGDTIGYNYDAENHRIVKTPSGQGTVTYGLDLLGEPYLVAKAALGALPAYSTAYTYDGAGRKSTETNNGLPVTYAYDASGNRSSTTWPDGYYVSYSYDALNRMQYVRENSFTTNELAYYTYDALSRRTSLCMGAGATSCASAAWTNNVGYGYEPLDGQLYALTHQLNATTVSFGYARNNSYQIQTLTASDAFYLPTPGAAAAAYVPNGLNEYGSVGGRAYTYDLNGNLQTWLAPTGQNTYAYDSEDRLISAAVGGSTTPSIFYDYDALGRRTLKTVGGSSLAVGGVTTGYLLDGDEEIAEYNLSGTVARRYITGPTVDDRIAHAEGSTTSNPAKTYYHTDHHESVIDMTDSAGNVVQKSSYDEYGNLSAGSTPNTGEQFQYTGRRYDPETGLYYYRARYYAPSIGRFLQADPIGSKDDLNLYAYVYNDPMDRVDPSGNDSDAMGNYIPGTEQLPGEFNPLEHPGITLAVLAAPIAATACGAGGCEAIGLTGGLAALTTSIKVSLGRLVGKSGSIYKVPGTATPTGRPYVGRHNQPNPAQTRRSPDGRDRTKAKVTDTYDPKNPAEGKLKEQKRIDKEGGVPNTDNKRNEVAPEKKKDLQDQASSQSWFWWLF
jgi:RHS repeat-associated protein